MHPCSRFTHCAALFGASVGLLSSFAAAQIVQAEMLPVGPTTAFPAGVAIRFGSDLASLGDVNGDGINDLAIADTAYHGSQFAGPLNIGAVHIFSGTGVPAPLLRSVFGTATVDYFGAALATIDDMTGDGIGELAIGAHQVGGVGYVRIINPVTGATVLGPIAGSSPGGWFGHSLCAINDLDGDGRRDLVVLASSALEVISTATGLSLFGSVATINNFSGIFTHPGAVAAEDINGDGFQDIAIGAPGSDQVDVHDGNPGSFGVLLTSVFGTPGTAFGLAVSAAGDQDADGINDIAIGAPGADQVEIRSGVLGLPLSFVRNGAAGSSFGFSTVSIGLNAAGDKMGLLSGAPNTAPASGAAEHFDVAANMVRYAINPVPPVTGFGTRVVDAGIGANLYNRPAVAAGQLAAGAAAVVRIFFGAPPATATQRGTGCGPAGPGLLVPIGLPSIGNGTFSFLHVSPTGGNPGVVGLFAMGAPAIATPFPAPPCFIFFNPTGSASITFTPSPATFLPFPIPLNPGLAGTRFTAQAAILGGPSIELSNGVDFTVGY